MQQGKQKDQIETEITQREAKHKVNSYIVTVCAETLNVNNKLVTFV